MSEKPVDSSDIQTVLANLQEEIRQHRLALGELGAVERPDPLAKVRKHTWVNSHLPIGWPMMPRGIIPKITAYTQKIVRRLLRWYINPLVDQQNAYNAAVTESLAQAFAEMEQQAQHAREIEVTLERLRGEQSDLAHEREVARLRLQRLENWRRAGQADQVPPVPAQPASGEPGSGQFAPPVDYFLLGAQYRSEAQLASRVRDYDDLFTKLQQRQAQGLEPVRPVLDIGCGRGDLVAHLTEMGLQAYGIDLDDDALSIAHAAGRNVKHAEALDHLRTLADGTLAAITLIQVIEHLEIADLLTWLKLALRKLAPGGLIIAETVNPSCLAALANAYLLDPSHRAPMHPKMTRFLMEQAGFWQIQIRFLRPVPEAGRLRQLPALPEAMGEFLVALNQDIGQLNDILYGPQDYAAIARKPEESDA